MAECRGRGYWQIIVFVGARYKHVRIHEIGSRPYILGDHVHMQVEGCSECRRSEIGAKFWSVMVAQARRQRAEGRVAPGSRRGAKQQRGLMATILC